MVAIKAAGTFAYTGMKRKHGLCLIVLATSGITTMAKNDYACIYQWT